MTDFLGQMLRRSRHEAQERKRFYASLNDINPTSLSMIQASQSRAAAAAASSEAALRASMAAKAAADEAKVTSTAASSVRVTSSSSMPMKTITPQSSSAAAPVVSSSSVASSSASSSRSSASSASSSSSSSSPAVVSSSTSAAGRPIMTITQTPSYVHPSSSAAPSSSASAAASNSDSESTGMSTGGVIGAVAAGLVGLVVIGALFGWLFRKYSSRKKSVTNEKNWRQISDDNDGYGNRPASPYQDDIYGQDAAPIIGSRRALALARANANDDGRPPTMMERNVAGAGAWRQQPDYGAYPAPEGRLSPEGYGMDPHSRPYMQQAGRVPIIADQYQYQNAQPITPDTSRQLISPLHPVSSADPYSPSFVLGRPGVPQTDRQIAQHEDFADFPSAAVDGEEIDQDWQPHTATTNGDWAGQHQMPTPSPSYGTGPQLPMLPPMSPDSFGPDFAAMGQASSSQKQVYADVARAAGVMEPVTPTPAQAKYAEAAASASSSARGLPPLPVYTPREAPSPFQHGRPLSALEEVETPLATPLPSTAGAQPYGQNPFDDTAAPSRSAAGSFTQPQAPSTPVSAARFPPPGTPGVPQSVTSSPMRGIEERTGWHSPAAAHRLSHMTTADDDDVYGGI